MSTPTDAGAAEGVPVYIEAAPRRRWRQRPAIGAPRNGGEWGTNIELLLRELSRRVESGSMAAPTDAGAAEGVLVYIEAAPRRRWRQRPAIGAPRNMAESGGFEPPVRFDPYDGLANRWFKPLTQLSAPGASEWTSERGK